MEAFHLLFLREKGMPTMVSHPDQEHSYVLTGEIIFHVGDAQYRPKPRKLPTGSTLQK